MDAAASPDDALPDAAASDAAPPDADGVGGLRDRLLAATLHHVPFDGWTGRALAAGAADEGLGAADVDLAFPRGVADAVAHLSAWADARMLEAMADADLGAMRTRDRVAFGVSARLDVLAPHKEAVRRSAAWLALPGNAGMGARLVARTCDAIWIAAGDTATDFNWYTKRGLLAGVLASTMLVWLDDRSEGDAETRAFLGRRIEDVMRIGRAIGKAPSAPSLRLAERLPSPARFLRQFRRRTGAA